MVPSGVFIRNSERAITIKLIKTIVNYLDSITTEKKKMNRK